MSEAKKYDRSYKEQSVKLALEIGVKRASEELKVPYGTLYGWVQAAKNGDLDIEERTPENAMSLAEEIRQLRSEVKRLNKEDESASCRRSRREARPLLNVEVAVLCRLHPPVQCSVRYLKFLAGSLYPYFQCQLY